ncbi:MAG: ATP-binding cassette domain-containing protein [Phocaeicola vulgatus]
MNEAKVAFNRMFEFVGIPSGKERREVSPGRGWIAFQAKNISFAFFQDGKRFLDNISLAAFKDKMIFIIGESGCGKSTFCKIVERA